MFMTSALSTARASYVFEGAAVVERGYPQPDYLTHPSTTAHRSWYPRLLVTHKAVRGDPRERAVRQHPGRVDLPSVANARAGLDRQGGDIGGLHSPGARPDVQANHMSRSEERR